MSARKWTSSVWRDSKKKTLRVTLGELEKVDTASFRPGVEGERKSGRTETITELGLKLAPFDKALAKQFELDDDAEGVVIVDVERESSAREKGLQPGTLIVELNQEKISSPAEIAAKIEEARSRTSFSATARKPGWRLEVRGFADREGGLISSLPK